MARDEEGERQGPGRGWGTETILKSLDFTQWGGGRGWGLKCTWEMFHM